VADLGDGEEERLGEDGEEEVVVVVIMLGNEIDFFCMVGEVGGGGD